MSQVHLIVFCFMNSAKPSDVVNCGPLSETTCSGRPCATKSCLSLEIVLAVDVLDISGHFVCASTTTRNNVPMNSLVKPIWILCQALVGQVQGCNYALTGSFLFCWHDRQCSQCLYSFLATRYSCIRELS